MTYSIVARCPRTGRLGVAVQSHFFGVGSVVPWIEPGVGAVATQASAEIAHGPNGLELLRSGSGAVDALAELVAGDALEATRQIGIVDASAGAAGHTGASCIREAGHVVGDGYTAQANMMLNTGVPEAMANAFEACAGDELWLRLLAALDAAEELGGDIRGRQSAALVVMHASPSTSPGHDRYIDVRVEDASEPLPELRRLASLASWYRRLDEAETALAEGRLDQSLAVFSAAVEAHPENVEFGYWHAVVLANIGRMDEARAASASLFGSADGERWRELTRRLPASGTLGEEAAAELLS